MKKLSTGHNYVVVANPDEVSENAGLYQNELSTPPFKLQRRLTCSHCDGSGFEPASVHEFPHCVKCGTMFYQNQKHNHEEFCYYCRFGQPTEAPLTDSTSRGFEGYNHGLDTNIKNYGHWKEVAKEKNLHSVG